MIVTLTPVTTTFLPISKRNYKCQASVTVTAPPPSVYTCKSPASLYDVLRVKKNASPIEIKSAYRNLAKVYHPDSSSMTDSSNGRAFIEIHQAYSTLSDPSSRAVYDLKLAIGSGRRMSRYSDDKGDVYSDVSGYYRTRRWETDQCW